MTRYLGPGMALALALALLLGAACGEGGPSSVFEELLSRIPDTPETRALVGMNDFARAMDLLNAPLPGPDAGREQLEEYVVGLFPPRAISGFAGSHDLSGYGPLASWALHKAEYVHSADTIATENLRYSWAVDLGPFKLGRIAQA